MSASPPPYERYFDSKLPVVHRQIIAQCPDMAKELEPHFRNRQRYRTKLMSAGKRKRERAPVVSLQHVFTPHSSPYPDSRQDAAFVRLTSNASHVVSELDSLRKSGKKFVCINDDTDAARKEDNLRVQALLVDFLESQLPVPSQFELHPTLRNRWSRTEDLEWWVLCRRAMRVAAFGIVAAVVGSALASHFKVVPLIAGHLSAITLSSPD